MGDDTPPSTPLAYPPKNGQAELTWNSSQKKTKHVLSQDVAPVKVQNMGKT